MAFKGMHSAGYINKNWATYSKHNLDSSLTVLMAQIALPQFSDSALSFVRVPLAPQIPPNNKDIIAAAQLVRDLTQNYGMLKLSPIFMLYK